MPHPPSAAATARPRAPPRPPSRPRSTSAPAASRGAAEGQGWCAAAPRNRRAGWPAPPTTCWREGRQQAPDGGGVDDLLVMPAARPRGGRPLAQGGHLRLALRDLDLPDGAEPAILADEVGDGVPEFERLAGERDLRRVAAEPAHAAGRGAGRVGGDAPGLQHADAAPAPGDVQRGGEAVQAAADDKDVRVAHARSLVALRRQGGRTRARCGGERGERHRPGEQHRAEQRGLLRGSRRRAPVRAGLRAGRRCRPDRGARPRAAEGRRRQLGRPRRRAGPPAARRPCSAASAGARAPQTAPAAKTPGTLVAPPASVSGRPSAKAQPSADSSSGSSAQSSRASKASVQTRPPPSTHARPASACHTAASGGASRIAPGRCAKAASAAGPSPTTTTRGALTRVRSPIHQRSSA